jgi:cytohesin
MLSLFLSPPVWQAHFFRLPDLTPDEQNVLINIRKRKLELLQEINQLREELSEVNSEIEAMDTEEG